MEAFYGAVASVEDIIHYTRSGEGFGEFIQSLVLETEKLIPKQGREARLKMTKESVITVLEAIEQRELEEKIRTIKISAPEILQDAQLFVEKSQSLPWGFTGPFFADGGEVKRIIEKYDLNYGRSKPRKEDVSADTYLFFEAAALVWRKKGYKLW